VALLSEVVLWHQLKAIKLLPMLIRQLAVSLVMAINHIQTMAGHQYHGKTHFYCSSQLSHENFKPECASVRIQLQCACVCCICSAQGTQETIDRRLILFSAYYHFSLKDFSI
jgi:YHS domain-containing protein